jgi:hypothetical protein
MYEIEQGQLPQDFIDAWRYAGQHIQKIGQEDVQWLRATLNPPIAEHLSFRIGNQLFFVYVDVDMLPFVGKRKELFLNVAREATATPCVLKMKPKRGQFDPVNPGWGFIDAVTGRAVNPTNMVSNECIEISNWELHDFAIQIVRSHLEKEGNKVFSAQSSLHIDPSIWFEDKSGPCWVVVRAGRHPKKRAHIPANLQNIKQSCFRMSRVGFFASVTVANADDPFDPSGENVMPLYRGHSMIVRFEGLEPI